MSRGLRVVAQRMHAAPSTATMLAIPGVLLLVAVIYARPQELLGPLRAFPLLYLVFALAVFGGVLDLRLGNTRPRSTPLLPWVALFLFWSLLTLMVHAPHETPTTTELLVSASLYLLIAHGMQTFRALGAIAGVVLAMVIFVGTVAVEQGFGPTGCVVVDEASGEQMSGTADGRPCATVHECYVGDPDPGAEYACEHIGWMGTTSIGKDRVRYRGVLQDPNELALAVAVGLPLAFALGGTKRRRGRWLIPAATFAIVVACTLMTKSRGGQLVLATVLAAYFVKRFGARGLALGAIASLPLMLFGGRSGAEATSSTMERIDCWAESLSIWRSHPILGVGPGQFGEYHYLTAHNSYLLTLAELGLPGMFLFSVVVYLAIKIPVTALGANAPVARRWGMALTATWAGLAVGIFFLSFAYHYVLWIDVGLSGALYSAIKTHDPDFGVRFDWRDASLVAVIDVAIIVAVYAYTRVMLR